MGMELDEWKYKTCVATFGTGLGWATLYDIESSEPNKGHATKLLIKAKKFYEKQGKAVGGTVALNKTMAHLYKKLGFIEYKS